MSSRMSATARSQPSHMKTSCTRLGSTSVTPSSVVPPSVQMWLSYVSSNPKSGSPGRGRAAPCSHAPRQGWSKSTKRGPSCGACSGTAPIDRLASGAGGVRGSAVSPLRAISCCSWKSYSPLGADAKQQGSLVRLSAPYEFEDSLDTLDVAWARPCTPCSAQPHDAEHNDECRKPPHVRKVRVQAHASPCIRCRTDAPPRRASCTPGAPAGTLDRCSSLLLRPAHHPNLSRSTHGRPHRPRASLPRKTQPSPDPGDSLALRETVFGDKAHADTGFTENAQISRARSPTARQKSRGLWRASSSTPRKQPA